MTYISFPGFGIDPFYVNPVAFNIFGHPVMWYGVIIAFGMVLAFLYALKCAKFEKIKSDDIIDLSIFLILFGVIGARLYYVIFSPTSFFTGSFLDTLYGIVAIWNGGLAIYGAVIAGFITIFVVAKVKKMRFSTLLDVVSPAVMIGQIVGRWGNFVNAEAYGTDTDSFIRMGIHKCVQKGAEFYSERYVHPTFLYESLWNLVGFILIAVFYKKKKFNGQVFLFYMTWYGLGRAMIEGLRTDSLMLGGIRVSQLLAALTFLAGIALMSYNLVKVKKFNALSLQSEAIAESESSPETTAESESAPEATAESESAPEATSAAELSDLTSDTEKNETENININGEDS